MVRRYGLADRFFFVTLDPRGAVEACRTGADVILLDDGTYPSLRNASTKAKVLREPPRRREKGLTPLSRWCDLGEVEEAKFGVASTLAANGTVRLALFLTGEDDTEAADCAGIDFFFLEMDVWLLRCKRTDRRPGHPSTRLLTAPLELWKAAGSKDVLISVHQENMLNLNAGVYFVKGNARTERLFRTMLDFILKFPETWDQVLSLLLLLLRLH
jgi:hypothetical protein